jgi:hypothetical protein
MPTPNEPPNSIKQSLLGWLKNTLTPTQRPAPQASSETPAPAPHAPSSSRQESSLSLPGTAGTTRRAASTGALTGGATNPLGASSFPKNQGLSGTPVQGARGRPTAPLQTPEDAEAESHMRMRVITGYLKDPLSHPIFSDKPAFLKILTEERSHLHTQIHVIQTQLESLGSPPNPSARQCSEAAPEADLHARLAKYQQRQAQIYQIMKRVTGIKKSTGGTGFLTPPAETTESEPPAT